MNLIDRSYNLDEFEFMRSHYRKALFKLLTLARATKASRESSSGALRAPNTDCLSLSMSSESFLEGSSSRYSKEFEEMEFIARGGFGRVYKARHKLDGSVYAVKQINLRCKNASKFMQSLEEVKMLAGLHHPNIVAYKAAWLEPFDKRKSSEYRITEAAILDEISSSSPSESLKNFGLRQTQSTDSSDIVFAKSPASSSSDGAKKDIGLHQTQSTDSSDIVFAKSPASSSSDGAKKDIGLHQTQSTDSSDIVFEKSPASSSSDGAKKETISKDNRLSADDSSSREKKDLAICMNKERLERLQAWNIAQNSILQGRATLFVQMQLCEDNMRQWLDIRNRSLSQVELPQIVSVFIEILKGIEYIHHRGIVHHDIKPSNIFISKDLRQVQVGDFGLACCLLTHQTSQPFVAAELTEHVGRVGTLLYAAPEQIDGVCDSKSDIYSMGIILLELITPFQTDMERSKIIHQLKEGKIPTDVAASRPDLAKIMTRTVSKSVSQRPSATEVLKMIIPEQKNDNVISQLKEELARKDEELTGKDEELTRKDEELTRKDEELNRKEEVLNRKEEELTRKDEELENLRKQLAALKAHSSKES